jgi:hypothetical protein
MLAFGLLTVGCATKVPPAAMPAPTPQVVVAAPTAPAPQPQPDPITELIATSNRNFEAGQRELQLGHLERAKVEFNRALEVLLESISTAWSKKSAPTKSPR